MDLATLVDAAASRLKRTTADAARIAKLLTAAVEAVEEHGPGVGLGRIAERAGIPRPHVYRYFTNKDELDAEVVRVAAADLAEHVRPSLAGRGSPAEVTRGVISAYVTWAGEHPQLYRFVTSQQSARSRALNEVVAAVRSYLRECGHAVDVPVAGVASVVGLVEAGLGWWLRHHDETAEELIDRLSRHATLVLVDLADRLGVDVPDRPLSAVARA